MERSKKGGIDPSLPTNPENDKNWEDVSHPKAKADGKTTFKNKETNEVIRLDKGTPGKPGHEGHDHYHRIERDEKGREVYLDQNGNIVPKGSDASHLYPSSWKFW
jgi:hypothetical protein